jgi:hypothetical protein
MTPRSRQWARAALVAAAPISAVLFAFHHSAFDSPEKSLLAFVQDAPGFLAGLVALPLALVGLVLWLLGRNQEDAAAELRRVVAPWLTGRDWLLVLLAAVLVAADGYWVYDLYRTQSVTIEPPVAGTWRLFAGCADTEQPASCGSPRELSGQLLHLRVPRAGLPAVVDTGTARFKARIDENGLEPLPPVLDPRRASVLVFPFRQMAASHRFAFIAENVVEALRAAGGSQLQGQIVLLPFADNPVLLARWAAIGVKPDVVVSGRYDDSEIRATLAFSDASYRLSLGTEDPAQKPSRQGALPLMLPLRPPPNVRVPIQESATVVVRYPKRLAGYVAIVLAARSLANPDGSDAAACRAAQELLKDSGESVADSRLAATLAAIGHLRTKEVEEAAGVIRALIDEERDGVETTPGDLAGPEFVAAYPDLLLDLATAVVAEMGRLAPPTPPPPNSSDVAMVIAMVEANERLELRAGPVLMDYLHSHYAQAMGQVMGWMDTPTLRREHPKEYDEGLRRLSEQATAFEAAVRDGNVRCGREDSARVETKGAHPVLVVPGLRLQRMYQSLQRCDRCDFGFLQTLERQLSALATTC